MLAYHKAAGGIVDTSEFKEKRLMLDDLISKQREVMSVVEAFQCEREEMYAEEVCEFLEQMRIVLDDLETDQV